MSLTLFVGGVRSGKSALAENWALSQPGRPLMLATCQPCDAEMAARVAAHKQARSGAWLCLEEPFRPLAALAAFRAGQPDFAGAVVLDSLGMWIANLMGRRMPETDILANCQKLAHGLAAAGLPCALVSEECGLGFVPMSAAARSFGDLTGAANQIAAKAAANVVFVSCGLPLPLKGMFG